MKTDILTTEVIDKIAVVELGSPKKMYFDMAMGDALTEELQAFAGDPHVRVVIITGGTPGYFNRHFDIPAYIKRLVRSANETPLADGLALERNLFLRLCTSDTALARMRNYEGKKITEPSRGFEVDEKVVNHG